MTTASQQLSAQLPIPHLRIARPSGDLDAATHFYTAAFGFEALASFADHSGFDGVVLGHAGWPYHLEFTRRLDDAVVAPQPSDEDLLVFYVPDAVEWAATTDRIRAAGAREVPNANPYWSANGITVEDPDGYRIVVQRGSWPPLQPAQRTP